MHIITVVLMMPIIPSAVIHVGFRGRFEAQLEVEMPFHLPLPSVTSARPSADHMIQFGEWGKSAFGAIWQPWGRERAQPMI